MLLAKPSDKNIYFVEGNFLFFSTVYKALVLVACLNWLLNFLFTEEGQVL